jgi:hypothetical protein
MPRTTKTNVVLLVFAGFCTLLYSNPLPPVRLAVIPGEGDRAPDAVVFGMIEKNLLEMPYAACVEREQVSAALKELALAANLDASQRTLQLGRILPADLFVFVEGLSGTQPRLVCVSVVEARTAIVLASWIGEQQDLQQPDALFSAVRQAVAKARVPLGQRRAFSLLSCHSDEPSRTLDPLAQTLGELLLHDLGAQNDCVVLDRSHCQRIREEEALAFVRQELKKSIFVLEFGIRHGDGPGQIAATVIIRSLQGAESGRVAVVLPADDLAVARRTLATAVAKSVGATVTKAMVSSAAAEARIYRRTAEILMSHSATEEAVRAAEVAYALEPSTDAAEYLAETYGKWVYRYSSEKKQTLMIQIRERELVYGVSQQRLEGCGTNSAVKLNKHWIFDLDRRINDMGGEARLSLGPGEECMRELLLEKIAWDRRIYHCAVDHAVPGSPTYFQELALIFRYGQYWAQSPQEFEELYRRAFCCYLDAPVCADASEARFNFLFALNFYLPPGFFEFKDADYRQAAARVFQWVVDESVKHSDVPLQFCALTALAQVSDNKAKAHVMAMQALNLFVGTLRIDHPDRKSETENWAAMAVDHDLSKITNITERIRFREQILSPVIDSGEVRRLETWKSQIIGWINALDRQKRTKEAFAICTRVVRQFEARPPTNVASGSDYAVQDRNCKDLFVQLAAKMRVKAGLMSDNEGAQLVPVEIGSMPAGMSMLASMEKKENALILVWTGSAENGGTRMVVTRVPAIGGIQELMGEAIVPVKDIAISALETTGQDWYVGLRGGGFLALDPHGHSVFWSETNGLPGNTVLSLACAAGRIFVSVAQKSVGLMWIDAESGALYEFVPRNKTFIQLASSRSTQGRHGLDGGTSYSIESMLFDDARQCLWMGVSRNHVVSEIWRYSLTDGIFVRVPATGSQICGFSNSLRFDGETIFGVTSDTFFDFDPAKNRVQIIDENFAAFRWPCIRVAGALVSVYQGDLRLDALDGKPPPVINRTAKGTGPGKLRPAYLIRWNDHEFLIGSTDGRIWRVTL